jgi:hypothetical protein
MIIMDVIISFVSINSVEIRINPRIGRREKLDLYPRVPIFVTWTQGKEKPVP